MLKINLSPQRQDRKPLTASYTAPILTVAGVAFDLSLIPDGATAEHEVLRNCSRSGDNYELTLTLPHGANAPEATRFPESVVVTSDGVIDLPVYDAEVA